MLDGLSKQTLVGFSGPEKWHSLVPACNFLNTWKTTAIHNHKAWRAALGKWKYFVRKVQLTPHSKTVFSPSCLLLISGFGEVAPVVCREGVLATVWSHVFSCKRGTGQESQPRRPWRDGPCSECGSPSGRCSPWMGQTGREKNEQKW